MTETVVIPPELKSKRRKKTVSTRGHPVTAERWYMYQMAIQQGQSLRQACVTAGISRSSAMRMKADPERHPEYMKAARHFKDNHPPDPRVGKELTLEAHRALNDFAYFRLRYFGLYSTPWQIDAAETIVALLDTEDKEYAVINAPPGSGKSWLFTLHITTWLIVRNRGIRILIGSASERVATDYGDFIKQALERTEPIRNKESEVEAGRMAHAESTLVADFGRFKPTQRGVEWTRRQFRVEQADKSDATTREKTVSTYGRDGTFLGGRFDFVIWDDLVSEKTLNAVEARDKTKAWWDSHAENRIDAGGVIVLQGQRLHPDDLYRYCLDKPGYRDDEEEDELTEDELASLPKLYKHVIYKAHYPEHCRGLHKRTDPAYDPRNPTASGCLLDPRRLTWKELARRMQSTTEPFDVVYQQEDVAPGMSLVPKLWIDGGRDPETGVEYRGCWDKERSVWELPPNLTRPLHMVITADPSPSNYWAVQAWVWQPSSDLRFLVDLWKGRMQAPDFLDFDVTTGQFSGLLETWWHEANRLGVPFKHVVIENNAAQTFIKQYNFFQTWATMRGVLIVPHETYQNKADKQFGVQTIAPHYEHGRVRLPGNPRDVSRGRSMALYSEVTRYPISNATDDQVMAHWFFEYTLQKKLRRDLTRKQAPLRMPPHTLPNVMAG